MSPILRRTAAIAAVATVLLLTGCAGRSDVASSQTPLPTPTVTATATPAPPPSSTPAPSPTATEAPPTAAPEPSVPPEPSVAPSTVRCTGADLALEYRPDPDASGAGSSAFDLVFTNTTAVTCTLAGIPGVYATDADGVRLGAVAAATGPNPGGLLSLIPSGQADVRVTWHSPGAYGCPVATSASLVAEVVDAVNAAVRAPASIEVCTDDTVFMEASTYTLLG
ncbi:MULTISPECIES: DUF4232 domain-containing protein [unclassified Rathayibacter]|uniref:DUF4232 domain-containing protein n=1 Tax=unclassified Rathayibacter TaxID=2609250 RepID=UPI000701447B|nr:MULTISPECIES: DUF4232 domain-containing protein [unclassified Rathayibacter]KQQ01567.1 hypothetical protein ASF42_14060 [Rathayibacter sp. Leaf294]KQS11599.1 hypothetical protein ASG06_14060 [Rathayibacter sp. Leaf185]